MRDAPDLKRLALLFSNRFAPEVHWMLHQELQRLEVRHPTMQPSLHLNESTSQPADVHVWLSGQP